MRRVAPHVPMLLLGAFLLVASLVRGQVWQAGMCAGILLLVGGIISRSDRRARDAYRRPGYIYDQERDR